MDKIKNFLKTADETCSLGWILFFILFFVLLGIVEMNEKLSPRKLLDFYMVLGLSLVMIVISSNSNSNWLFGDPEWEKENDLSPLKRKQRFKFVKEIKSSVCFIINENERIKKYVKKRV